MYKDLCRSPFLVLNGLIAAPALALYVSNIVFCIVNSNFLVDRVILINAALASHKLSHNPSQNTYLSLNHLFFLVH